VGALRFFSYACKVQARFRLVATADNRSHATHASDLECSNAPPYCRSNTNGHSRQSIGPSSSCDRPLLHPAFLQHTSVESGANRGRSRAGQHRLPWGIDAACHAPSMPSFNTFAGSTGSMTVWAVQQLVGLQEVRIKARLCADFTIKVTKLPGHFTKTVRCLLRIPIPQIHFTSDASTILSERRSGSKTRRRSDTDLGDASIFAQTESASSLQV
jgi:hypothetical protein